MSRHAMTEPIRNDNHLIVAVTPECFSQSLALANGRPRLVIDYGGYALVLDVADPVQAEAFAFGLAYSSLDFANRCRYLMDSGSG